MASKACLRCDLRRQACAVMSKARWLRRHACAPNSSAQWLRGSNSDFERGVASKLSNVQRLRSKVRTVISSAECFEASLNSDLEPVHIHALSKVEQSPVSQRSVIPRPVDSNSHFKRAASSKQGPNSDFERGVASKLSNVQRLRSKVRTVISSAEWLRS